MTAGLARPSIHVVLAPALLRLFPHAPARVDLCADTIATVIGELDARWPGMGHMLRDERPAIRAHINVFVEGARGGLMTPIKPGATVYILTSVSGG